MKNIAICLSGQPRNWKLCYQSWLDSLSHIKCNKHFFIHFWNHNSLPRQLLSKMNISQSVQTITDAEKEEIISTLNPKLIKFEPIYVEPENLYESDNNDQLLRWSLSQFYSLQQSASLKQKYEMINKFQYDAVIRIRSDLMISSPINLEYPMKSNSIYTTYSNVLPEYNNCYITGDILYAADSPTYDQITNFYDFIPHMHNDDIEAKNIMPEVAFHHYLRSVGITIKSFQSFINMKITRNSEYLNIKGYLDKYESI